MNIEHLQEFVTLATELSFTRTAKLHHITQPALSKHIANLEAEFDCSLFDRSQQPVRLSLDGRRLLELCLPLLSDYEYLRGQMNNIHSKTIRIAIIGTMRSARIINLLHRGLDVLKDTVPDAHLMFTKSDANLYPFEQLANSDIDLLFSYFPQKLPSGYPDITSLPVLKDPLVAVVESDNPLAQHQEITMEDLKNKRIIKLLGQIHIDAWEQIESLCNNAGFSPKELPTSPFSDPDCYGINIDQSVFLISESNLTLATYNDGVFHSAVKVKDAYFDFGLFCLDKPRNPLARTYFKLLEEMLITE